MNMPSVGEPSSTTTNAINNMSKDDLIDGHQGRSDRKISRVSKLRDMFQNGIVRPIEEIDNVVPFEETMPEVDRTNQHFSNYPRSFPGSPPLSALRAQRLSPNANPSVMPASIRSLSTAPPACPPKPRHLVIDRPSPSSATKHSSRAASHTGLAVTPTEKDYRLRACIQPLENGPAKSSSPLHNGKSSQSSLSSTPAIIEPDKVKPGNLTAPVPYTGEVTASASITPTTKLSPGASDSSVLSSASVQENHTQDAEVNKLDSSMFYIPVGRLSSWQGSGALNRISSQATPPLLSGDCQQFIVQRDSFQSEDLSPDISTALLQRAEPIDIGSADDDDEAEEADEVIFSDADVQPTLPVPKGLRVITVNPNGVHVLEDGNFFYAAPCVSDEDDAVEDGDLLSRPPVASATSLGSPNSNGGHQMGLSLELHPDDTEEKKPRVRFSTDPVLVYSTHSVGEYNRRNEDIDPLGASAEYELEKHLESMDLVTIDLLKGPQGLGFSILGLGVDQFGGSQKLGIFIKLLTPGGAAELDGRIKIYDQIVEVDGVSMVGVAPEFAATTLRGTKDTVHFILAREKDPENSRVAKLLRQQEREQNMTDDDRQLEDTGGEDHHEAGVEMGQSVVCEQSPNTGFSTETDTINLPRDDSLETLQRHLTALDTTHPSLENDDCEDGSGKPLEFTANPLFEKITQSNQSPPRSPYSLLPPFSFSPQQKPLSPNADSTSPIAASDSPSPRSALKGTATAASTQRRNEAISLLIQLATDEVKSKSPVFTLETEDVINFSGRVTWCLASNLHDCHDMLTRQRTRLRSLEQRLTAQEAAADEAIERLCLQCRRLEAELVRSSEYLRPHRQSQDHAVEAVHTNGQVRQPPSSPKSPSINSNHATPVAASTSMETSDYPTQHSPEQPLSLVQQAKHLLGSLQPAAPPASIRRPTARSSDKGLPAQSSSSPSPSGDCRTGDQVTTTTRSEDAQLQPLPPHLQQARARLHASGGLASRRPPTCVVVDPPFVREQGRDSSLHGLLSPPLIETSSWGTSLTRDRDDNPTRSPTRSKSLDPRPVPVSFLHRTQQYTSNTLRSSPVLKLTSSNELSQRCTEQAPGDPIKPTMNTVTLPGGFSSPPPDQHQPPPIGSSSLPTSNSFPLSTCHLATSERIPLRWAKLSHSPPKSNPDRPQPIRTPGHPTPLQLQQQQWYSHQSRTSSASPSSS